MKALLLALTLLVTVPALADWVLRTESAKSKIYVDVNSIRVEGNLRKVWELYDLKQRSENGMLSFRTRVEYDCKEERFRTLSFSTHSEAMATGRVLSDMNGSKVWSDIPPGSPASQMLELVCSK